MDGSWWKMQTKLKSLPTYEEAMGIIRHAGASEVDVNYSGFANDRTPLTMDRNNKNNHHSRHLEPSCKNQSRRRNTEFAQRNQAPSVIRYYGSDYVSRDSLKSAAVIHYYKNDYVHPNNYHVDANTRELSSKISSRGITKTNEDCPKLTATISTKSTLPSITKRILKTVCPHM